MDVSKTVHLVAVQCFVGKYIEPMLVVVITRKVLEHSALRQVGTIFNKHAVNRVRHSVAHLVRESSRKL